MRAAGQGLADCLLDEAPVLGVDVGLECGEGAREGAASQAVNGLQLRRPCDLAGGDRPIPCAHLARRDGEAQALLALADGRLGAPLVHHAGAHGQQAHRERGHEALEQEQGLVGGSDREWAHAADGTRDRDGGEDGDRRGRLALAEADRGPEQRGDAEEGDGHVPHGSREDAAEYERPTPSTVAPSRSASAHRVRSAPRRAGGSRGGSAEPPGGRRPRRPATTSARWSRSRSSARSPPAPDWSLRWWR
jgi:hypothetical protein